MVLAWLASKRRRYWIRRCNGMTAFWPNCSRFSPVASETGLRDPYQIRTYVAFHSPNAKWALSIGPCTDGEEPDSPSFSKVDLLRRFRPQLWYA